MQIPAALHQDTKDLPRRRSLLVLPSALLPLLVFASPFIVGATSADPHWGWWLGGIVAALGWAVASGFLARSPKPWASLARLLGWIALWCLEPFVALPLVALLAGTSGLGDAAIWVGVGLYLCGALGFGYALFHHYRAKR
ncbi:hypothetical protein SAMN05216553_107124 [Lentzea fradiae]|uniref:Uncharacterized protein n=1 Tax=Lentzea fradiae TaxID=200378 RepID=A0A1G7TAU1_9PSEU|nr:hypothetical protein [Lentzea fradiae]SDG32321.1 hypothetical protein SAMN05216553_107124 [Lentzea fradiae]